MIPIATVTFWCMEMVPRATPRMGARRSPVVFPHLPPALVPGTDAAGRPGVGVLLQVARCLTGHGTSEWLTRYVQVTIGNSARQASSGSAGIPNTVT